MEKIKEGFKKGVEEGRRAFLKRLLTAKGVEIPDIQKLYSSGLMDPEMLQDISLGDLINISGVTVDRAKKIKDIILRQESYLPPEYEKAEIERIKKETDKILSETGEVRSEIEKIEKEYLTLKKAIVSELSESEALKLQLEEFEEKEKNGYFREKRLQDEVIFLFRELGEFQYRVKAHEAELKTSNKKLESHKREFLFTKGECEYLLEKINYLMNKLDAALEARGAKSNRFASFLAELKGIHDRLEETYKNGKLNYYTGKIEI